GRGALPASPPADPSPSCRHPPRRVHPSTVWPRFRMHWVKARWKAWFDCTPRTVPAPIPPVAAPIAAPRPAEPAAAPIAAPAAAPISPPPTAPRAACPVEEPDTCIASCRHSCSSRVMNCARELPYVSTVGLHCDWDTQADKAVRESTRASAFFLIKETLLPADSWSDATTVILPPVGIVPDAL